MFVCVFDGAYWKERSEQWQEGEKGTEFQERLDALESILTDLTHYPKPCPRESAGATFTKP